MACTRESYRIASALLRRQLPIRSAAPGARRFASTEAEKPSSNKVDDLSELDDASSFNTPAPDAAILDAFKSRPPPARTGKLPANRYQYHPPKFDRGPLHPVQSPPSSDPIARNFVPGPFNHPRLRHTHESTIAPDLLTLTYQHYPPGEERAVSTKGELREWDGSSPYHKNRPKRGPRGPGSDRLALLERDIVFNNIPEIKSVSISMHQPEAARDKEYLNVARAVLQAITGKFTELNFLKKNVVQFQIRKGGIGGVNVTLDGNDAYEFVDKLVTLVLPKIKEWPGVKATSGDDNGNISLGLHKSAMTFFPELEYNFSAYPAKMIPGCYITIQTTATSDRHGRLLLESLGFPFYGKVKN
ncbi:ribosomal protein L5 domain-containing protein [Emericellopsis atlantica]|uniref:Ribosomal protein L5 domain-containing protein n=1 Tax=Emericellopsis atlantica TaxID=2614577 RepID=A0A9P7ZEY2_9HYPO|nr:ribosomal protein L5 domain-containing protein [Emericellopsis atlantica]KAG9250868.1 ribosomal protein L5 domain-containing protein [Emericellopsis atlantica]